MTAWTLTLGPEGDPQRRMWDEVIIIDDPVPDALMSITPELRARMAQWFESYRRERMIGQCHT